MDINLKFFIKIYKWWIIRFFNGGCDSVTLNFIVAYYLNHLFESLLQFWGFEYNFSLVFST